MEYDTSHLKFEMINTMEWKEKTLDFLRRYFFLDEPLVNSLKIADDSKALEALEKFAMKSIDQDVSIMVLTPTKDIAGIALNSIKRKGQTNNIGDVGVSKFEKATNFLEYLEKNANTFERFPDLDKFLSLDILSVDPSWRRKGISKSLVDKVKDFALSQDFKLIRIDCTSQYSAKTAIALGFEVIFSIRYEDYKENGEQVFEISDPHSEAKAMVLYMNTKD